MTLSENEMSPMSWIELSEWPGKSGDQGEELSACIHMLDVGACAEILIDGHTAFSSISPAQRQAIILLVILHDVGKLTESFRSLIRENVRGNPLHWQLSDFILRNYLDDTLNKIGADKWVRAVLYSAVAGHHGRPPDGVEGNRREKRKMRRAVGSGENAARQWSTLLLGLFPNASLEDMDIEQAKSLSWVISGLTVTSDWVGSNIDWFPLKRDSNCFEETMKDSCWRARQAVEEAGLLPTQAATLASDSCLGLTKMRPMQETTESLDIEEGPQLAILEDSTGTGKTEAAMILARRMILAGKARGLFFALPTIATSDAIFERLQPMLPNLFEAMPTTVLTHSRAKLYDAMRALKGATQDVTPESDHIGWLTDGRRRALLAAVCVGTIDQALLGVLPTKFSTLRLFGLADKLLIVDEAHSYDPYMQEELKGFLRMQAMLGGSAIIMTATLPLSVRKSFTNAFQDGLSQTKTELKESDYPSLHMVGKSLRSQLVEPYAESIRTVKVERVSNATEALGLLVEMAKKGAACVWIRNAVDEAIDAVEAIRREGVEAELLHARFAMSDRLQIEQNVIQRFGKNGTGREGRILVSTQVVEASLDLDFDVMISDLAPIGSLIQRAGRLWRHMEIRPIATRPVSDPILHVISPDPEAVNHENWLQEVLGRGSYVYRLDEQWKTAKVVFDAGEIKSPDNLRKLIETVHGECDLILPEVILNESNRMEGERLAQVGVARTNVVNAEMGYAAGANSVGRDSVFPTRLGEPQLTLVLARIGDNVRLIPWADHEDEAMAWSLSEVVFSKKRFERLLPDQNSPKFMKIKESWPDWKKNTHMIGIVDHASCEIGDHLLYDNQSGLRPSSSSLRG